MITASKPNTTLERLPGDLSYDEEVFQEHLSRSIRLVFMFSSRGKPSLRTEMMRHADTVNGHHGQKVSSLVSTELVSTNQNLIRTRTWKHHVDIRHL